MSRHFYKYHGTGNDFILIDNTRENFNDQSKEYIAGLCHRHFGIGADGLILLEHSAMADFKMVYFNSDGHLGSMCGNGGRCATHLAYQLGLVQEQGDFEGPDGLHKFRINKDHISISMKNVSHIESFPQGLFVDTGSPHLVCFRDEISTLKVFDQGRRLRDEFGPSGTNVNFVGVQNGQFSMRTYERGVEAETLSCGTGATAVAVALKEVKGVTDESITLETLGGKLTVSSTKKGSEYTKVWLSGPVVYVFKGDLS